MRCCSVCARPCQISSSGTLAYFSQCDDVQKRHLSRLRDPADGILGSVTIKSLQTFLRKTGEYQGPVDGKLKEETIQSLQTFLVKEEREDQAYSHGSLSSAEGAKRKLKLKTDFVEKSGFWLFFKF